MDSRQPEPQYGVLFYFPTEPSRGSLTEPQQASEPFVADDLSSLDADS